MIRIMDSPSTANRISVFANGNQRVASINWKFEIDGSKANRSKIEALNTKRDQNKEKFRIKCVFVLSTNKRIAAPTRGSRIKADNI
jgi:hypothetical protein